MYEDVWDTRYIEQISSLLALMKNTKFTWCFHQTKLVICSPCKRTKNLKHNVLSWMWKAIFLISCVQLLGWYYSDICHEKLVKISSRSKRLRLESTAMNDLSSHVVISAQLSLNAVVWISLWRKKFCSKSNVVSFWVLLYPRAVLQILVMFLSKWTETIVSFACKFQI